MVARIARLTYVAAVSHAASEKYYMRDSDSRVVQAESALYTMPAIMLLSSTIVPCMQALSFPGANAAAAMAAHVLEATQVHLYQGHYRPSQQHFDHGEVWHLHVLFRDRETPTMARVLYALNFMVMPSTGLKH